MPVPFMRRWLYAAAAISIFKKTGEPPQQQNYIYKQII